MSNPTPFFLLGDDSSIWDDYSVSRRGSTRPTWRIYLSQKDNSSWVLFRSVFNCSSQLKRRPLLIADSHFDRPSVEKYSLCSPWFVITLATRPTLKPGRLFLSSEQPRMRQNEGILCYCMTVFTPPRWRRSRFSDVIVMWLHTSYWTIGLSFKC